MTQLPRSATPEGQAGLDALLTSPRQALIGTDFDGTLAPIVADPRAARALPGAVPTLRRLARAVGTLAVITGRPAAEAVAYGGLDAVPGLIVLGHYGWQRWQGGELTGPESPPPVQAAREALPAVLARAGAPDATWVEDKGHALAVHTRRTADPDATLCLLRGPLDDLAERLGLAAEPGRMVIELRPPGVNKGTALTGLVRERGADRRDRGRTRVLGAGPARPADPRATGRAGGPRRWRPARRTAGGVRRRAWPGPGPAPRRSR